MTRDHCIRILAAFAGMLLLSGLGRAEDRQRQPLPRPRPETRPNGGSVQHPSSPPPRLVPAQPQPEKAVLVIDFTGHWDQGSGHARTFQETVLPGAHVLSIGIHGVIPDHQRADAGYDAIVRTGSKDIDAQSAAQVKGLIQEDHTIIGFDINEGIKQGFVVLPYPEQIRQGFREDFLPAPDKITHPALIAAEVAVRWRQEHPDGVLILRGHSDGTYAVRTIFDDLKQHGLAPDVVILESPRQNYSDWKERAKATPQTKFLSLTATDDFSREALTSQGYANIPSANWVNVHVQGQRWPWVAHSVVTDYWNRELRVRRTDHDSQIFYATTSLGQLVRHELAPLFAAPAQGSHTTGQSNTLLTPLEDRTRRNLSDPWGKGGVGGISPLHDKSLSGADPHTRGGISVDIQLHPHDFVSQ